MKVRWVSPLVLVFLTVDLSFVQLDSLAQAPQVAQRLNQPLLAKLPAHLRVRGTALLEERDTRARARLVDDLARADAAGTMEFFLSILETEPSGIVRLRIADRLGRHSNPRVQKALERTAVSDPDVAVSLMALEHLRIQRNEELRGLFKRRMELASQTQDRSALNGLAREDQRWVSLVKGTMLPAFMQTPPALFSVKSTDLPIRVLAFGDFGNGSKEQKEVAAAMQRFHQDSPFDFAITLGDNFYSKGMESPADPRWKTWWDALYDPMGIKIYASLGNHDWGFPDSPAAEVLYTRQSPSWRMPATYYTFTAGPVQFFALDTNEIPETQLQWLDRELGNSQAPWKLVYGHHPIYSAGVHEDSPRLVKQLLPVLKNRANIYLAGHDHDLQHLKPEGRVHFFVSGGGGAGIRLPKPGPRSIFASATHGFSVIEADLHQLKVTFVDRQLNHVYEHVLKKHD